MCSLVVCNKHSRGQASKESCTHTYKTRNAYLEQAIGGVKGNARELCPELLEQTTCIDACLYSPKLVHKLDVDLLGPCE